MVLEPDWDGRVCRHDALRAWEKHPAQKPYMWKRFIIGV